MRAIERGENKGTVLILISNVGLQLWLGTILHREGYTPVPATNPTSAFELLALFGLTIDLLIVDPTLSNAGEFTEHLRRSQGNVRVFPVTPELSNCLSETQWLKVIRGALAPGAIARLENYPGRRTDSSMQSDERRG